MPTVNLGRVKPIHRGEYSAVTEYRPLDVITYNNNTYFCIATSTGNLPTDTDYFEPIVDVNFGTIATQDADDVAITGGTANGLDIGPDAQLDDPFSMMPIGMTFSVPDHLTGADVPSNSGTRKYIKLTAGLTGAGEFNEGLLTNESVSGSAPLVEATAEIVGGPMDGETIHLLNSMGAFIRPGTTSGVFQQDQFQGHSHRHQNIRTSGSSGWSPTLQLTDAVDNDSGTTTGTRGPDKYGGNGAPRVGTETRPKNVSETFYRRII